MTVEEKAHKFVIIAEAWRREDRDDIEWLKMGYGIVSVIDAILLDKEVEEAEAIREIIESIQRAYE